MSGGEESSVVPRVGRKVNVEETSEDEKVMRLERLGSAEDQVLGVTKIMEGEEWVGNAVEICFLCAVGHGWELEHRVLSRVKWARFTSDAQLQKIATFPVLEDIYRYCENEVSAFKAGLDDRAWTVVLYRLTALLDAACPSSSLGVPFSRLVQTVLLPYKQRAVLPTAQFSLSEAFGEIMHLYHSPLTLLFNLFQADGRLPPDGYDKLCKEFEICPDLVSLTTAHRILADAARDTHRHITSVKHLAHTLARLALEAPAPTTTLTPAARLEHLIHTYFSPRRGLGKTLNLPEVTTYEVPQPTLTTVSPLRIAHTGGTVTLTGFNLGILQLGVYVTFTWGQAPDTLFSFPEMEPCETIKLTIPPSPDAANFQGLYVDSRVLEDQRVVVSFTSVMRVKVYVHNCLEACSRKEDLESVVLEVGKQLADTVLGPQISTFIRSLFDAAGETKRHQLTYDEWVLVASKFNIPLFDDHPFTCLCGEDRSLSFKQFVSLLGHTARMMEPTADLSEVLNSWFTPGQTSKLYQAAVHSFRSTRRKSTIVPREDDEELHVCEESTEGLLPDLMLSKIRRASSVLQSMKTGFPDSPSAAGSSTPTPLARSATFKTSAQLNELSTLLEVLAIEVSDINSSETELQAQLMKTREEAKHMAKSSKSKDDALRRTEQQKSIKVESARKSVEALKETLSQRDGLLKDWNACCKELLSDLHEMEQWCDMFLSQSVRENPSSKNTDLAEKYLGSLKTVSERSKQKIRDLSRTTVDVAGERHQTRAITAQGEEYVKLYNSIREDVRRYGEQLLQQVKADKEKALREMNLDKREAIARTETRLMKKMQENQKEARKELEIWKAKAANLETTLKITRKETEMNEESTAALKDKLLHVEKLYQDEKETRVLDNKIRAQRQREKVEQVVPSSVSTTLRSELADTRAKVKELLDIVDAKNVAMRVTQVELEKAESMRLKAEFLFDEFKRKNVEQTAELKMLRQLLGPGQGKRRKRKSRAASVSPLPRHNADEPVPIRRVSIMNEEVEDKDLLDALDRERKENAVLCRLLNSKSGAESCLSIPHDQLKLVLQELIKEETEALHESRVSSASLISRKESAMIDPAHASLLKSIITNTMQNMSEGEDWQPAVTKQQSTQGHLPPLAPKLETCVFEIKGGVAQLGINWRGDGDGFTVADVARSSIAARLGIVPGMKLLNVNGKRVNSTSGLQRAMKALNGTDISTWQFCSELREVQAVSPAMHASTPPPVESNIKTLEDVVKHMRSVHTALKKLPLFVKKMHSEFASFMTTELNMLLRLSARRRASGKKMLQAHITVPAPSVSKPDADTHTPQGTPSVTPEVRSEEVKEVRLSNLPDVTGCYEKAKDVIEQQMRSLEAILQGEKEAQKEERHEFIKLVGNRVRLRLCTKKDSANMMFYSVRVKNSELEMEKWAQRRQDARQKLEELVNCQEDAFGTVASAFKTKCVSFQVGGSRKLQAPDAATGLRRMGEWVSPATMQKAVKVLEIKNTRLQEQVTQLTRQARKRSTSSISSAEPCSEGTLDDVLQSTGLASGQKIVPHSTLEGAGCMELVKEIKAGRAKFEQQQKQQPAVILRRRIVFGKEEEKPESKVLQPKVPATKVPPKPRPAPISPPRLEDAQAVFNKLVGAPPPSPKQQGFKAPVRKPPKSAQTVYEPIAFTQQSSPQNAFRLLSAEQHPNPTRPGTTQTKVSAMNRLIRDEIASRKARTL